jgi:sulfur carrier protein
MKEFLLNGKKYSVKQTITLFDIVHYFNYDDSLLVLEYNNLICNKKDWKTIFISQHDKIEVVTIVGGG